MARRWKGEKWKCGNNRRDVKEEGRKRGKNIYKEYKGYEISWNKTMKALEIRAEDEV